MISANARPQVRQIIVVPHTHWDREWFGTFQQFRFHLVEFMDELIELLEQDAAFKHFLLDGQMILIEDYLEIRPGNEERLRRLIREDRIQIGPWYAQPDEFLVSGEALVRNLLIGDRLAKRFGKPMKQGYIPDTFGHIEQLPQILLGFGIGTFFFWRGLGAALEDTGAEFWWEGPDGSRVFAHYLSESYSNAGVLADAPERMSIHHGKNVRYDSMDELVGLLAGRTESGVLLFLNGSDHMTVQRDFTHAVRSLDAAVPCEIVNGTLEQFASGVLSSGVKLKTLKGELRYGRYHPVLKDVLSTRMYLKQWNESAQQLLETRAERYASVLRARGGKDYSALLHHAWKKLLQNHPHDSICGCSVDEVHRQMLDRYSQVVEIGRQIVDESLAALSRMVFPNGTDGAIPIVAFNPSPWPRSGPVGADVLLMDNSPLGERKFGYNVPVREIDLAAYDLIDEAGNRVPFRIGEERIRVEDILQRRKVTYRQGIEFLAEGLPAMGHQVYRLTPRAEAGPAVADELAPPAGPPVLDNGILRVTPNGDGTVTVEDLRDGRVYERLHAFEDEADAGDEYTFSEPEAQRVVSSRSAAWHFSYGDEPYSLKLEAELMLPAALSDDRRRRADLTRACRIAVRIRLLPGSERLEFRTEFDNQAEDHRFRAVFATGIQAAASMAETSYGLVNRPVVPEPSDDWREANTSTYAQRRFVFLEDGQRRVAVFNKGLPEYEATEDGRLYITLIRAVGWLSRGDLRSRAGNAGPSLETKEAQCPGVHICEYAVVFGPASGGLPALFRHAEEFHAPLEARSVQYKTAVPVLEGMGSFLEIVRGDVVLSAIKKAEDGEATVVRLFNATNRESKSLIRFDLPLQEVALANLNEEPLERIRHGEREIELAVGPCAIVTLLVVFRPTAA